MQTARCIENHNVVSVFRRVLYSGLCNIRRTVLISHGKHFHALLFPVNLQLFYRRGTVYITGHKERFLSFYFKLARQLRGSGCLTCALKTCHHNNGHGTSGLKSDLRRLGAHKFYQLFIYDLDHHLSGIQPVHNILSDRAFLDIFDKSFDHLEVDICLQKSHPDFLQCRFYVIFRKSSLTAQIPEYIL